MLNMRISLFLSNFGLKPPSNCLNLYRKNLVFYNVLKFDFYRPTFQNIILLFLLRHTLQRIESIEESFYGA